MDIDVKAVTIFLDICVIIRRFQPYFKRVMRAGKLRKPYYTAAMAIALKKELWS